jgi:NAD(P)-dependent dehydrogenase (short-subunit alcohol dehydrogenase family)
MDFTQKEWDDCIKVLKILAREPEKSLDTNTLKGLVTKLHKRAKKQNKADALHEKVEKGLQKQVFSTENLSLEGLSLNKIKKIQQAQVLYKQHDKLLTASTLRFRNYENTNTIADTENTEKERIFAQKCYECKQLYHKIHHFYHLLCPDCAVFNYEKRIQTTDLTGRVALITGGRIKIGYLTALRMLRDGAKVWLTTRFVNDAALRFAAEPDFENWSARLKIVALDLRNLQAIQDFIAHLLQHETHLDIIINNAAQTIKRPPAFYAHLFALEQKGASVLPQNLQKTIVFDAPFTFLSSASEQAVLPQDAESYFPQGLFDENKQQIDKRPENSWTLLLDKISPLEMIETQLVNVTAPFLFNSALKPLLMQSPFERKFIVNVSAMEGQFEREDKTPFHAHTNMAKAALNMMTRTSAQDYAREHIFMNSVDTGWITQENPFPTKERLFEEEGFVPPLDEIDGAARIYDPIVSGINHTEIPLFGHFLKNYKPYNW